jgi:hypothetical protein
MHCAHKFIVENFGVESFYNLLILFEITHAKETLFQEIKLCLQKKKNIRLKMFISNYDHHKNF